MPGTVLQPITISEKEKQGYDGSTSVHLLILNEIKIT